MQTILTVRNLSISFTQYEKGVQKRNLPVIRDLSLQVEEGQITAVAGSSGSGKSLLAHGILGILPLNSHMEGEIRYYGDILTQEKKEKLRGREIVLIPQGVSFLDPLMKIGPQIQKGRKTAEAVKNTKNVLSRYGLEEGTQNLYPFELSGGMLRRVLIATAVVESPKLVIADEPTPGLDVRLAGRILSHFRELADGGAGVLFITHDLETAMAVADKVIVFYGGETIEEAFASDFQSPKRLRHPYTRALWNAMPQNGFIPIPGTQPYPGEIREGCLFAPRCPSCRPECREQNPVPYYKLRGGKVRCLYAE